MLSDDERGPFGAWAKSQRDERGWSVEDVVVRLEDAGEPISASYLRRIETGKLGPATQWPSRRLQKALARVYEATPPAEERGGTMEPDVAEHLRALGEIQARQTDVLDRLSAQMLAAQDAQMQAIAAPHTLAGSRARPAALGALLAARDRGADLVPRLTWGARAHATPGLRAARGRRRASVPSRSLLAIPLVASDDRHDHVRPRRAVLEPERVHEAS